MVIGGQESEWKYINAGVPQGSILGPLLFLMYMNDIVENISSDASLFADDTSLIRPIRNQTDVDALNDDLNEISHWAAQWRVTFNARKTVYMIVSKKVQRPPSVSLYLQGIPIERVKSHCYLNLVN